MSVQAVESAVMSEDSATRLTEKIRITAHNYAEARQKLSEYVAEAKAGNAHLALGYASWTAYLAEVLGEEPMRLARGERQEMVQMLSSEGMSTRAIAPIVGASQRTVANDLGEQNCSPEPDAPDNVNTETGEIEDEAPITGMDGKQYTRPVIRNDPKPETSTPRPDPVASQFTAVVIELNRDIAKLQRLTESRNYKNNIDTITEMHASDITRAINTLQSILETLN